VLRAVVLTQYRRVTDRQTDGRTDGGTDGQTDGIAVASTALAMPALRRAVKMRVVLHQAWSKNQWTVSRGYLTIETNIRCY